MVLGLFPLRFRPSPFHVAPSRILSWYPILPPHALMEAHAVVWCSVFPLRFRPSPFHVAPSRILSWYPTLPPTHRCPLLLQPSVRSPIHIPPTSCPRKYRSPPQLLVLLHLHPSPASTSQYRITLRHPLSLRSLLPFPCLSRRPVATPTLPLRALGMFADPFFLRAPPSESCILHVDNLALLRALCAPDSSAIPHCCHAWSNSACFDPVVPTPYFPGAPPC